MKLALRISLMAGMLIIAAAAWAQTGTVVVNIDHDFMAAGKLHLAGKYKVFPSSPNALVLRSQKTGDSVFLLAAVHQDPVLPEQSAVKLTLSGETYYLSEVKTDLGVYSFPTPRDTANTATARGRNTMAPSGSN